MTNFREPTPRASARTERIRNSLMRADLGVPISPRTPWYSRICALRVPCSRKRCQDRCDIECHHLRPVDLKGTLECGIGAMRYVGGGSS